MHPGWRYLTEARVLSCWKKPTTENRRDPGTMDPLFMPDFTCCSRNWDSANQEVFFSNLLLSSFGDCSLFPVLIWVTVELLLPCSKKCSSGWSSLQTSCYFLQIFFHIFWPKCNFWSFSPSIICLFQLHTQGIKKKSFTNNFLEKTGIKFFNNHKIKPCTDVLFLEDFKIEVLVSPALTDSLIVK